MEGLKQDIEESAKSPSMRREWIEMVLVVSIESDSVCLPPCGGSGLKCCSDFCAGTRSKSPSMRREWIEIAIDP